MMEVPDTYYEEVTDRIGAIDADLEEMRRLNILADADEGGHAPADLHADAPGPADRVLRVHRETRGASGFGEGNFKALFEAIERDQAARGNL